MRRAGKLASEVLDYLTPFVQPGITTNEIDRLAHDYMTPVQGTLPAILGYCPPGYQPYPQSLCTSLNHQIFYGLCPADVRVQSLRDIAVHRLRFEVLLK